MVRSKDKTNALHTITLICAMAALAGFVGYVLGGRYGLIGAVLLTLFGMSAGVRISASMVLKMYKAQPMHPQQAPNVFAIYHELCRRADLPHVPRLYYVPSRMPNAFAVGSEESSAIAVTDGIFRMMTPRELAGILAHEITHVQCHDTFVLGIADVISRTVSALSRVGLLMMLFGSMAGRSATTFWISGAILFFSPTVAVMLQLALSRTREFNADRGAAELTGDPHGLASALRKLDRIVEGNVFEKILRPGLRRQQPAMLRTHPPTEERIEALMEIAEEQHSDQLSDEICRKDAKNCPVDHPRVRQKPRYHFLSGIWR